MSMVPDTAVGSIPFSDFFRQHWRLKRPICPWMPSLTLRHSGFSPKHWRVKPRLVAFLFMVPNTDAWKKKKKKTRLICRQHAVAHRWLLQRLRHSLPLPSNEKEPSTAIQMRPRSLLEASCTTESLGTSNRRNAGSVTLRSTCITNPTFDIKAGRAVPWGNEPEVAGQHSSLPLLQVRRSVEWLSFARCTLRAESHIITGPLADPGGGP